MTLFFFNNFFIHIVTVTKMFQVSCELKSLFPATKIVSSSIFNSLLKKFSNVLLTCFSPGPNFQLVKNFPAEGRSNQKPKKWTQTNSKIQSKPTKLFNCSCKVHKSSNKKKGNQKMQKQLFWTCFTHTRKNHWQMHVGEREGGSKDLPAGCVLIARMRNVSHDSVPHIVSRLA